MMGLISGTFMAKETQGANGLNTRGCSDNICSQSLSRTLILSPDMNLTMIFSLIVQDFHFFVGGSYWYLGLNISPYIMSMLLFPIFQLRILRWFFQNQSSELCSRQNMVFEFN